MIPIIDGWVLIVDEHNYTIARYKGKKPRKDGSVETILREQGYYGSLGAALEGLRGKLERETLMMGYPTIHEAFRAVMESNERVSRAIDMAVKALDAHGRTDWKPSSEVNECTGESLSMPN